MQFIDIATSQAGEKIDNLRYIMLTYIILKTILL